MSDKLAFLDDEQPEPEAEVSEAVEAEEIEAEGEGQGDTGAPPAPADNGNAGLVPIQVVLAERDRVRETRERAEKAEREAEELRQWRAQIEAKQKAQPAPDFFTDPDQRLAYERKQFEAQFTALKLQQSRFLAERDFGAEEVKAAYAYFDQNPHLSQQLLEHPSPFHAAVEFYKRQRVAEEIGADPEAWKASQMEAIKEQLRAEIMAELGGTAQPKPRLPGSLASAPAAGKAGEPRARGSAFDAAFGS